MNSHSYYCSLHAGSNHFHFNFKDDSDNVNQVSFQSEESGSKKSGTTPRKPKKKGPGRKYKGKKSNGWDTTTIQTYADYSTNAEGAAILASLGQYNNNGQGDYNNYHCVPYPDSVPYSADSFPSSTEGSVPFDGSIVSGMTLEEYYGGSQAAAAVASYYRPPTFPAEGDAAATAFHPNMAPVQQQQPGINPYYMYGMPQYPMYYSYYPVMHDGMVFYTQQQQWDENTPPAGYAGENVPAVMAVQKTRLNVDAPSFEPKKIVE